MTSTPSPLREPSRLDGFGHATWLLDGALAALLFLFTVIPTMLLGMPPREMVAAVMLGTMLITATLWRRRAPLACLAATVVLCLVHLWAFDFPTPPLVVVLLVAYSVARWVPGRRSRLVLVAGAIGSVSGPLEWLQAHTYYEFPWTLLVLGTATCFGLVTAFYAFGRRVREGAVAKEQSMAAEIRRHQMEIAEHEQRVRIADASARAQIARELHDIVAHSLSVMVVQAEGGRALALKKPEQAAEVLDTIAETGREALTEMRRIVGVLRDGPDEASYAPTPGLEEIPELVTRSGVDAQLIVDGDAPEVPTGLGLTAYRVAQEALTNVLKHAGPQAHAVVRLAFTPMLVVVEVTDDGPGTGAPDDGLGHGLQGMRERVAAMQGHLVAEPGPAGGFVVRAMLPVPQRPPGSARATRDGAEHTLVMPRGGFQQPHDPYDFEPTQELR